jgi:hypothetical protein
MGNIIEEKGGDLTLPPNLRPASKEMVMKELVELERRASDLANKIDRKGGTTRARAQLAKHIRELHLPTIAAMTEAPEVIAPYFEAKLPEKLERDIDVTSREMRFWAEIARLAAIEMRRPEADRSSEDSEFAKMFPEAARIRVGFQRPKTRDVGRPQNRLAQNVANELARVFMFTGKRPTVSTVIGSEKEGMAYGPFLDFTREIFALLYIEPHALFCARTAGRQLRAREEELENHRQKK